MKIGEAIQQGEVYIRRLPDAPDTTGLLPLKREAKGFILSHSERGHHHILTGGDVMERPALAGMDRFYAILEAPEEVIQDASTPHGKHVLPAGFYDIRISREFDPFSDQVRRVAD